MGMRNEGQPKSPEAYSHDVTPIKLVTSFSPPMEDNNTVEIINRLIVLLKDFENLRVTGDLRTKVQALVPIYDGILSIGPSLVPREIAVSASKRLLHYFLSYPFTVLPREELAIVAGIDQWARRIRELRVEQGWTIVSGTTANKMAAENEFLLPGIHIQNLRTDDYIMIGDYPLIVGK